MDNLKLENQLCFPIYLTAKELTRVYDKYLKELNLTYTQYIVMMYFWDKKKSNVKELSKTLIIDSSTLTPLLVKLENKGFIKREKSNQDERNLNITLTKDGEILKEKARLIPEKAGSCIGLNIDEAKKLYELIYKVLNNILKEERNGS